MAMATHPRLVWPRSDGNEAFWPPVRKPKTTTGRWYEQVELGNPRYLPFEEAAGAHLAAILGIPVQPNGLPHRIPVPAGYKIYITKRPAEDPGSREHLYLYGSSSRNRFKPSEWKIHAAWLFSNKPLDSHQAECKCISKPVIAAAAIAATITPALVKSKPKRDAPAPVPRPPPSKGSEKPPSSRSSANVESTRPSKRRRMSIEEEERLASDSEDELWPSGVMFERAFDLKSQRRFRRGELVWVRIKTIAISQALPDITHWPAHISDIRLRVIVAPPTPSGPGDSVSHCWAYHLRPLGMFSQKDEIVADTTDMLPWAIGEELLGGRAGWESLAKEGTRNLNDGIAKEAEGREQADWALKWGWRIAFSEMRREDAVFRLSVAIKMAAQIALSWCNTDKIDILPQTILSDSDRQLVREDKKNFHQGIWLGGERIWVDDIVRLRKSRGSVPFDSDKPSVGAVFMKIRAIALEKGDVWQCHLYGDIAELISLGEPGETKWTEDGITSCFGESQPPYGFKYHRLNDLGTEAKCDISEIAGRIYPDLLDQATQNWIGEAGRLPSEGRQAPTKIALCLKGRLPGFMVHSAPGIWQEDLFAIVDTACKTVEQALIDYYTSELNRLSAPPPPVPRAPPPKKPDAQGGISVLRPIVSSNNTPVVAKPPAQKPNTITSYLIPALGARKPLPVVVPPAPLAPAAAAAVSPSAPVLSKTWTQGETAEIVYTLVDSSPEPMVE